MRQHLCFRIAALATGLLILLSLNTGMPAAPLGETAHAEGGSHVVYLPVVRSREPAETIFGVGVLQVAPSRGLAGLAAANTTWLRTSASLLWKDIEPVERGGYNWDAPSARALEQEMIAASQNKMRLIVIAHGSPRWATAPYQADCAPINDQKYDRFAAFMSAAVERYSQSPYNVEYWEIGNEPDAPIFDVDSGYGCWGKESDQYYGGREYGRMLNAIYPAIKTANPRAKVLNGGLLLDSPTKKSSRFLEGMLVAGAAKSFDILNYHSYTYDNGTPDGIFGDGTAGKVDWKVGFLRGVFAAQNVPMKPMINTETALLCYSPCQDRQADALPRLYARARKDGLLGLLWYIYDSDGFRNTGLVEPGNPSAARPAFHAYTYASSMLGTADYLGPMTGQPDTVEGYRFRRGNETIIIFWANQQTSFSMPMPAGTTTANCTNRQGSPASNRCSVSNGVLQLSAGVSPVYAILR